MRALAVALVFGLAACVSLEVDTEHDRRTDFSTFKTWDWLAEPRAPSGHPRVDDPALHNRVRNAVERELAAKGYERVFSGSPDFRVAYHLSLRTRLDSQTVNRGVGYAVGDGWGPGHRTRVIVHEYEKGTLILDVVDPGQQKLVFRGVAKRRLPRDPSPSQSRKNVREAVEKILEAFPPR